MQRLVVGMTGASGVILGIRLLQALKGAEVETHLIMSKWAQQNVEHETNWSVRQVRALATECYGPGDMGAPISSGSFLTDGMAIVPCSVGSLAAIAQGQSQSLVHRAADVVLKERRRLVLAVRETPLSEVHLENMLKLARMGVTILPPMPAFYNHPRVIEDIVEHIVVRLLDQFDVAVDFARRWEGQMQNRAGGQGVVESVSRKRDATVEE